MKNFIGTYIHPKGWRGWLHVVIVVVLVIALIRSCTKEYRYEKKLEELTNVKPVDKTGTTQEAEVLAEKVNKEGQTLTTFKEAEPIIKLIEDNTKADSIAKIAEVDRRRVAALTIVNGELSKENTDLKREIRTLIDGRPDTVFTYKDPWFSAEGFYKNDTVFSLRNISADISVNKIDFKKRKYWLLGRNENLTTIYYNSPYAKVNGLETLKIKQKEPLLNIDLSVEGRFLHNSSDLLLGPKVRLGIGRFGVTGGYMVSPTGALKASPWYGVEYKVY